MSVASLPDPQTALAIERVPPGNLRELYRLWLDKKSPDRLPARRDFDPVEMPLLLPHITLFDVEYAPLRFRVRLIGTAVAASAGMDSTGVYLDELADTADTIARCRQLVETRLPYFQTDLPLKWTPHSFKTFSVIGLPLAADGHTVDLVLGGLDFG